MRQSTAPAETVAPTSASSPVTTPERVAVIGELDEHVLRTEPVDEAVELGCRRRERLGRCVPGTHGRLQRAAHGALAAAGEDRPVAAGEPDELVEVVPRSALLLPAQLRVRQRRGKPMVSLLATGQDEQVRADRIRHAVLRCRQLERELRAEHRLD